MIVTGATVSLGVGSAGLFYVGAPAITKIACTGIAAATGVTIAGAAVTGVTIALLGAISSSGVTTQVTKIVSKPLALVVVS